MKGYIGKNNMQNDQLTFKTSSPSDEWFHAKDMPGSHVILQTAGLTLGKDYTEQSLLEAAGMAAAHSKGAAGNNVPVDHTERRYVKKPAAQQTGFCHLHASADHLREGRRYGVRRPAPVERVR